MVFVQRVEVQNQVKDVVLYPLVFVGFLYRVLHFTHQLGIRDCLLVKRVFFVCSSQANKRIDKDALFESIKLIECVQLFILVCHNGLKVVQQVLVHN